MLLTVAEIAKRLALPESTARYYRTQFEPWLPVYGEGRSRRYGEEAVEVLRFAAEAVKDGVPVELVRQRLAERFPTTQEAQPPATTTVMAALADVMRELLREQHQTIAQENNALRSDVVALRSMSAG